MAEAASTAANPFTALLGEKILRHGQGDAGGVGRVDTAEALAGAEVVALYFSAHWCGPCRQFTPFLVKLHQELREAGKQMEVVFVSSDQTQDGFAEYYASMPNWFALPFGNQQLRSQLGSKFQVRGIPTLVLLDAEGNVLSTDGRSVLANDPTGADFPWRPKSVLELLGDNLLRHTSTTAGSPNESVATSEAIAGKYFFVYFSASWCGPCHQFTPRLVAYFEKLKERRNDVEVVLVSSDRDQRSFDEYFGIMPWLAVPFGDDRSRALGTRFQVEGIPTLALVGPDGEIMTTNARSHIMKDPRGEKFPYLPSPVEDIDSTLESYGYDINQKPSLICFMEGADDTDQEDAKAALTALAEEYAVAHKDTPSGPQMIFFYNDKPSEIGSKLRGMLGLPTVERAEDEPQLAILDIGDQGGYYVNPAGEVTEDSVRTFVAGYFARTLERKQLG